MGSQAGHRLHAARVAAIAAVIVLACYLIAVVVLNIFVVQRLTNQTDVRLSERLVDAQQSVTHNPAGGSLPVEHDHDVDDAPAFVWLVSPNGATTSLTPGGPQLPTRQWTANATTIDIGGTSFRFEAIKSGTGWLVAGASIGQIRRVQNTLVLPEVILAAVVLVLVFLGAWAIGLRASAPLEVVRRRQTEFTADASHELRTPLSVIEAEVDLALSRPRDVDAYQGVLERIAGEGRRLRSIVDDLLWLARLDADRPHSDARADVDVAAVAEACVDRFQAVAAARQVTLGFQRDGQEPASLTTDPTWIDRLIGVLVDNACRYADVGGVVTVGVRTTGARIFLDVDDSGPGISPEQRELVFDRFHRGVDAQGGTGLGLAIADSVVRATGGSWSIGTAPLGGARMEVSWHNAGGQRGNRPRRRFRLTRGNPQVKAPKSGVNDPALQPQSSPR
ncbi:MAG TPA: HAMP domain-containing sensor histidine kinase [Acidimicrobiales bacterium]|nr:HAMP domain-containing sensor histidine kinase [Acidimicrobiales bacterium]